MNKKGYIRTIETIIAIVIIFGIIVYSGPKIFIDESITPGVLKSAQEAIFDELTYDDVLREQIITTPENSVPVEAIVDLYIPAGYGYEVLITRDFTSASIDNWPADKTIYVKDMMISSTMAEREPVVVRLYSWRL